MLGLLAVHQQAGLPLNLHISGILLETVWAGLWPTSTAERCEMPKLLGAVYAFLL